MTKLLYLGIGTLVGGFARYFLAGAVYKGFGTSFPYGTLAVNLLGCFVIGFLSAIARNSRIHTAKILRLSEDLPVIIEIVDSEEKINAFLPCLDEMVKEGLVTFEKVNVIMYRGNSDVAT